jgi:hypothetical protein
VVQERSSGVRPLRSNEDRREAAPPVHLVTGRLVHTGRSTVIRRMSGACWPTGAAPYSIGPGLSLRPLRDGHTPSHYAETRSTVLSATPTLVGVNRLDPPSAEQGDGTRACLA